MKKTVSSVLKSPQFWHFSLIFAQLAVAMFVKSPAANAAVTTAIAAAETAIEPPSVAVPAPVSQ